MTIFSTFTLQSEAEKTRGPILVSIKTKLQASFLSITYRTHVTSTVMPLLFGLHIFILPSSSHPRSRTLLCSEVAKSPYCSFCSTQGSFPGFQGGSQAHKGKKGWSLFSLDRTVITDSPAITPQNCPL